MAQKTPQLYRSSTGESDEEKNAACTTGQTMLNLSQGQMKPPVQGQPGDKMALSQSVDLNATSEGETYNSGSDGVCSPELDMNGVSTNSQAQVTPNSGYLRPQAFISGTQMTPLHPGIATHAMSSTATTSQQMTHAPRPAHLQHQQMIQQHRMIQQHQLHIQRQHVINQQQSLVTSPVTSLQPQQTRAMPSNQQIHQQQHQQQQLQQQIQHIEQSQHMQHQMFNPDILQSNGKLADY